MAGLSLVVILVSFGLATGIVGKIKGSSFFIWFLVGSLLPVAGLAGAILHRWERDEPRYPCPRCGLTLRITDQVCMRCGADVEWRRAEAARAPSSK